MIEESAVVVKIENHQVWVESGQVGACGGCRQKASCTTGALDSVLKKKKSIPVDSEILLETGDHVIVAIDENLLLRASLLLYFVPLVALFTGAGIADWLITDGTGHADLWIAGSAVLSFLLSLWSINKAQSRLILNYYARPVVVRKV
jgi:sigma-E factor negative regulatory protein RseC